uniref:C2H2-type domain-containing protein n=1 Tax=Astatotilapia calliptera TaxID=8154 RepID=A0A3P8R684_ASTCA
MLFLSLQLVEEYASRWQVLLPQLRILEIALCYFAQASSFFTSNCDHVLRTLSSLALSVFELLLFFDQNDFYQEPLKHFTDTFQECYLALAKHQNVHLLQVERLVQGGGPWANPTVQAILSESSLPQNDVDGYISSQLPVFFELRVRYLLSCERIAEAMALAKCCARHPNTGQHLFFLQVYLTWLYKTSQHDCLHKEVADLNGKNAVHIICNLEFEETDELLLALITAFLSQQLWRGDMYYLCDLVFLWTKLHTRLNTSKQVLLEETRQLMLSATNVNSIFPFIRSILQEVGDDGIQLCVELCANALKSCLPCDTLTKSLIYKTIAGLLHNDLEVCRACALLVFFLERTVESYKMVYLLYMHPDQEYDAEYSSIGNNVRFETLQVLKKDLYFDPEFWNLIALRTNCLKLMNEKVVSAALEEIMEDKWISNYCTKDSAFRSSVLACQKGSKSVLQSEEGKSDALEVDGTVQTQDGSLDTWENSELMETPQESEESKLEYCCTFCKKDFKGTRVVAHAMFHYRKDECMFCGKVFTDDLQAMMHLSDHIEKLKRIKAEENGVKLRSNDKPVDGSSSQEKHNTSKHLNSKSPVHKVNGHIDKKKEFNRQKKDVEAMQILEQDANIGSSAANKKLACSTEDKLKVKATKQIWKVVTEKNTEPQEKISCPADGCSFFTDISKNRVALLYHALDDHYGELKPLELAFHVGNNKCSICMRVLWSFEHFQHHVERHRWSPRHPCLHQGCTARFKSGMEMRRHARKHSPLQAVCCLPGCSHLFICLWALNLHEREHYASKSTNSDKNTNAQTGDKLDDASAGRQQQSLPDSLTAAKKTESVKTALKLPEQASQELLVRIQDKAAPLSISRSSLIKQKLKKKNESKNSNVLKSLSNKETSAQPTDSSNRLRHNLRKGQVTNSSGSSTPMSGDAEDTKASVCKNTLAEYSKKPYMRLPPTAYLDEKYITMPKRRKDALSVLVSQMSNDLEQACLTSAVQRQRCANCFATFNSVEELQSHRQLQKCSDLFGFDSDDEGE